MNKQLLFPSAKCLYGNIKGIVLLLCLLGSASLSYAQTVTLTDATGEAGTLTGGQTNVAVFAFNLTRGTAVNLTGVTVTFSTPIAGIFTNVRLFESTDATFSFGGDSNVGTMTLGSGTDYTATFAARPIAAAGGTFYFIVVNIDPAILSTSTINVTCASTQIVTTDAESGSATGPIYNSGNISELRADFTQNADAATAMGDQNGVELLDFTVLSNGAQNITPSLVFTFDVDVTNILENWDLQVGGADIPGVENYALTGGGTILTVTGFTNVDVSTSKNFQLFADIKEGATSANDFTVSFASPGVTVDVGYPEAFTTFTNAVDVTALTADFTQNADAATALADQNSVELLDFDVLSNGTQSITPSLVFTFDVDITNILENWDLRVAGADIPGTENYALTGGGTILTVTGFTNVDVSTSKNFQLFADIKEGATSANDFTVSFASSGVTVDVGYPEAFTTFTNAVDVTALTADFTQNADAATALADQNSVELLDFDVLSNGTQSITPSLVFTFDVDITNILENWDLRVAGADIPGTENYALTGGGTILTVTGFTNVDVSTTKNFQLFADIKSTAISANDFVITFQTSGVAVNLGYAETFTFTNSVDVTGLTADFTQNADVGSAFADENGVELLDFTVLSNGPQNIVSPLVFTFNVDVTNILENWDLRVGGADIPGSENYVLSGGGTILTVTSFTNVDVSTTKNFQLYADIRVGALTTNDFTITFAPTGVAVDAGFVEAFGTFTNAVDIAVSALSDIVYTGGSSSALNYRTRQALTIDNTDLNGSFRLATFRLQDGGGASDSDVKATSITSITFQIDNPDNIRRIALFNETNSQANDDTEIAGTEQDMPASGMVTFTPSTPIRTLADGGNWNFMVRVTFKSTVVDNQVLTVTVNSVTGEPEYSAFTSTNAGGANSSAGPNKTIIVTASKFKFNPAVTSSSPIATNFGPATIVAVDGNAPLSNIDKDYNGKIDLIATGGPGALTGGGQKTLTAGTVTVPNLSISQSGTYSLEVSDDEYNDAPDNQPSIEDISTSITISSSASGITGAFTTPSAMCYGTRFYALSDIVITETDPAGISGSPGTYTFSIALPSGFVFDQTVTNPPTGLLASGGADINIPGGPQYSYPSANVVQFSFNLTGTANTNTLTIRGLMVGRPHPGNTMPGNVKPPALSGLDITRSGGSANIAGVNPGADLGTLNVSTPNTIPAFTVDELPGDVTVDPGTTNFNVNANSVKLVPSVGTGSNLFTGSGVTFVNPDYRFNPSSLSPNPYDIAYTNTDATGCQTAFIKTFNVYTSGINNLAPAYCTNDLPSPDLTVSTTFMNQRLGLPADPTNFPWQVDYYVYYDPTVFNFVPITSPSNTKFDPSLNAYQSIIQYFGGQIPIGFAACDNNTVPCGTNQNYGVFSTYQWVTVNAAPSPTFTLPKTTFCLDDPAVVLTGVPPNSDAVAKDFFSASDVGFPANASPSGTITVTAPPTSKVWSFNPGALGVGTADIRYTYENPATGCTGTSAPITVTVNPRPSTVVPGVINSGAIAPEICQGGAFGTFSATPALTAPNEYRWYSDPALTVREAIGNSFTPPTPPYDPNIPTGATPHEFYITQVINGCESNKELVSPPPARKLTVTVKPSPLAPTPNFSDTPDREFCAGTTIDISKLVVPGTSVKWYDVNNAIIFTGNNPTTNDLNIITPTSRDTLYSFQVSQTASLCEGPRAPLRVRIKALPTLSVSAGAADPLKICTSGSLITFSGSDEDGPVTTGTWTNPSAPFLTPGALIPGGGTALLTTTTLIPDNYVLRFTHTNSAGCLNSFDLPLTVLPKINLSLDPLDSCFGSFVRLNNESTVQTGPNTSVAATTANIQSTEWEDFDDGFSLPRGSGPVPSSANNGRTTGTFLSPIHNFANLGTKSIEYSMTTIDGCKYIGTKGLTINPKPQINFTWRNPCFDSATNRTRTEFVANETTSPSPLAVDKYLWNFKVNGNLTTISTTNETTASPTVNYNKIGSDLVQLIAVTEAQCSDTLRKIVYTLPTYKAITDTTGYDQNFNSGSNFWLEGGVRSSWALGSTTPVAIPTNGASWATGLSSSNNADEQSWVMSGCFNFSDSKKPVISLDIWSDTPDGVDGAVLQFNENGEIENEGSWQVLGDATSGINWYDGSGISSSPGNQSSIDYGWTGTYADWKKAIYKLDAVKPASPKASDSLIIFRVAFAGGKRQQSGFAFDNVFIGERSRVVLLENFTNTVPISTNVTPTTNHNAVYESFGNVSSNELVKIQYHTPFPGDDELNKENQQMNNSRAAFYGITEAPTARVDGGFQAGNLGSWLTNYNDDRVLTPSVLTIDTTSITKVGTDVKIKLIIENTTSQKLPLDGVNVFTVIVQKQIDKAGNESLFGNIGNTKFVYVAKQMLPTAAGIALSDSLAGGDTLHLPEITWSNPNGGDAIVVFVQRIDGDNKNVYQSILVRNPPTPDVVTGTEYPEYAKNVHVYPNPANHEVNIELPGAVSKSTPIEMYDAFGRVVYQSAFNAGEKTKTVSTSTFADGIYMLQLITPNGSKVVRKVMVTHR